MDDLPDGVGELLSISGNDTCMECDSNNVEWSSINLGIFLCESCGGRHRQLGVHTSRVQSLKLDTKIWNESTLKDMKLKGNINAKYYFESRVPLYQVKPPIDIGPVVVEDWIRNKYEKQLFIDPNNANNIYRSPSQSHKHVANTICNDEIKSNASLNFALHKMPCSPAYTVMKWIVPNENDKHQTKQQFIVLHSRFLSRYSSPSSHKCEQIIDITKYKIYIALSDLNKPCILAIDSLQKTKHIYNDSIRFEFEYYKDIKYWTELMRKSALFYKEIGHNSCASQPNDTVNSLLACSLMDLDNNSIYKHLKYGSVKKQHKFSIGWDKKWWTINQRRKILIYFNKDPRTMKPNKKNPMFIEAQGGYYINEIMADIDNNGYRSGQPHCLLLYHFNKTIFIKFDDRWPLIQFWKELHLKGRDVKYIGAKPMYYEKALCQENVDVQVMHVLNKRNSKAHSNHNSSITTRTHTTQNNTGAITPMITITHKNTATATATSTHNNTTRTRTTNEMDDLHMNSTTISVGSPPIPPSYEGPLTINGMGIGTAILNHEMLNNQSKMTIHDMIEKVNKEDSVKNEMDNRQQSITDFNQSDLLHNPLPPPQHKPMSSLRMLMDLHHRTNGTIQNDTNLSDDDNDENEPFDYDLQDDMNDMKQQNRTSFDNNNNKHKKKTSNVSDSFNDDFGVFDYVHDNENDIHTTNNNSNITPTPVHQHNNNNNHNESPLRHLLQNNIKKINIPNMTQADINNIQKRASPIEIKQSVSQTVSDNDDFEMDIIAENKADDHDINNHIIGRLRTAAGSMEELQYLADNTPLLPDPDDEKDSPSTQTMNTNNITDMTLTDPPSEFYVKQLTNSEYTMCNIQPELLSNFSDQNDADAEGNLSEEEDVMYKDHRRGTVEQYAEKNKYKSRTYRNFTNTKNGKSILSNINKRNIKVHKMDHKNKNDGGNEMKSNITKVKLPAPPPKRKRKGNELTRQYQLNAMQIRKLSDADMMQQIMIQVGSMASFFVQPGSKLIVHLHGTAQTMNSTHNTLQMWQYVEELLSERIGQLTLLQHK